MAYTQTAAAAEIVAFQVMFSIYEPRYHIYSLYIFVRFVFFVTKCRCDVVAVNCVVLWSPIETSR